MDPRLAAFLSCEVGAAMAHRNGGIQSDSNERDQQRNALPLTSLISSREAIPHTNPSGGLQRPMKLLFQIQKEAHRAACCGKGNCDPGIVEFDKSSCFV
jgi:hypothetical protein